MQGVWSRERIGRTEAWPVRIPYRQNAQPGEQEKEAGASYHLVVRIETESGAVGWGEARPERAGDLQTLEWLHWMLEGRVAPALTGLNPFARHDLAGRVEAALGAEWDHRLPLAAAALEMALWDLRGRISGLPLHVFMGGKLREWQPLTYTISSAEPEAMARCAFQWREAECLKVELTGDPARDEECLRSVQHVSTHHLFWLGGRQTYTSSRALELLHRVEDIPGIVCFEQPLPGSDSFGMAALREKSPMPIALDEGALGARDVARAWALRGVDMVVLKVGKSGGLWNTLRTADWCETMGLERLGSGPKEAGIAFTAAVHLFSTRELRLPAELNGPQWLEDLFVRGLEWRGASVRVPDGPGLGVQIEEEALQELRLPSRGS